VWGAPAAPAAKQQAYNISVHVSGGRIVKHSESAPRFQYLNVTIDGRKYELESMKGANELLALADYRARLSSDEHNRGYDSRQVYEFQFPTKEPGSFSWSGS
jgi:hypothetical protein